jgi:ferritin-like metal-binding protein YciE
MTLETLNDLYVQQLRDIYDAEQQLVEALPEMAVNATHPELRKAFESHLEETKEQVRRLKKIFARLGEDPEGETCDGMEGIISEGEELLEMDADDDVLDAGLLAGAQHAEHYEIAGYGTLATYAQLLGEKADHELLTETLKEEKEADAKLTKIAKSVVNPEAVSA